MAESNYPPQAIHDTYHMVVPNKAFAFRKFIFSGILLFKSAHVPTLFLYANHIVFCRNLYVHTFLFSVTYFFNCNFGDKLIKFFRFSHFVNTRVRKNEKFHFFAHEEMCTCRLTHTILFCGELSPLKFARAPEHVLGIKIVRR